MAFATINSWATANTAAAAPTPAPAPTPVDNYPAIDHAFASEPLLRKRVYDAIRTTPQHAALFEDIARYTSTLLTREAQQQTTTTTTALPVHAIDDGGDGPAAKKRKLVQNGGTTTTPNGGLSTALLGRTALMADAPLQFYVQDLSFAVPQRKKLTLEITAGPRGVLRARNQTTKEVEFGVALDRIQHILCLPVPEKTQRQFNFCVIPQYADGINPPPDSDATPPPESIVWTVPDGPPKAAFSGTGEQLLGADTAEALIRRVLDENLNLASNQTKVVRPDEKEFVSAMPEAHRKTEKAFHVKAFRGSKEGYLFLLSTGIFFGFKKPLLFFAYENIDSISYTSVLQRTFNLNITARPTTTTPDGDSDETIEFEFSMIDQADFAGIDAYVKRHGLQDASLAEARRARRYNVNGTVKAERRNGDASAAVGQDGGGGAGVAGDEGEESELQKAQRELEDREDEEEEDYDPGSDGDSDGSGSSSEEDEDDGYGGEAGDGDGDGDDEDKDLVAEELGSEAEEVPEEEL